MDSAYKRRKRVGRLSSRGELTVLHALKILLHCICSTISTPTYYDIPIERGFGEFSFYSVFIIGCNKKKNKLNLT